MKKKLPIKPFFNRVLLEREQAADKTKGGIIIPGADKNPPSIGLVLDVGESCDEPIKKLVGKRVLFARLAGDWIRLPNVEKVYFLCSDEDILGQIL